MEPMIEKEKLSVQIGDRIWVALVVYLVKNVEGGACKRCGDRDEGYYLHPVGIRVRAALDQRRQQATREEKVQIQRKLSEQFKRKLCVDCLTMIRQIHLSSELVRI